ncbi:MAG TPA: hypothetical protein VFA59_04135 [Vicinamibacterales bacterium]|nr:hypothetical protein [Vicinamibacterales bacterium]
MSSALDTFRAQQQAAGAVYHRLQEVAVLLRELRTEAERLTNVGELKMLLERQERWFQQTRQTVIEVRRLRETDSRGFWHDAGRWIIAAAFAVLAALAGGAGYGAVTKPYFDEVQKLHARIALTELVEDRVLAMTAAERKQFDALMKWPKR